MIPGGHALVHGGTAAVRRSCTIAVPLAVLATAQGSVQRDLDACGGGQVAPGDALAQVRQRLG